MNAQSKVMHVLLLLGSNSEDAAAVLAQARQALATEAPIVREGSLWRTAAWGFDGPDFVNQVLEVLWSEDLEGLLDHCLEVERRLGRVRPVGGPRYQSRRIDIDLLVTRPFVQHISERLELPHPRMAERRFVLQPVSEHWTSWRISLNFNSVEQLLLQCADANTVHLLPNSNIHDS